MIFASLGIQLQHIRPKRKLSVADAIYAHAAVMHTITRQDERLGKMLHDTKGYKPMSLAIVKSNAKSSLLRLSFISELSLDFVYALTENFSSNPNLNIGTLTCQIVAMDFNHSKWGRIASWADLINTTCCCPYLQFKFATPTAITQKGSRNERFMMLFPEPVKLFSGLEKRWNYLNGPPLPENLNTFLRGGGCIVSQHNLRTIKFKTNDRSQIGFIGRTTYECRDKNSPYVAALNALTQFAFFSGVGYQTARGMGAVQTKVGGG